MANSNKESFLGKKLRKIHEIFGRLQRVLGFRLIVTVLVLGLQAIIGLFILQKVYEYVRNSKLRDVWAILYLEMEREANKISESALSTYATASAQNPNHSTVEISPNGAVKMIEGTFFPVKSLRLAGVESLEQLADWNLLLHREGAFVLKKLAREKGRLRALVHPFDQKIQISTKINKETKIYIASRQGHLLYSNSLDVKTSNFNSRPLVQYFIRLPINQGQIDLGAEGQDVYGFFNEVPGTNLVIFAETSKAVVTEQVFEMVTDLIKHISLVLLVGILLLQFVLLQLLKPITALVELAQEIAKGRFDVKSRYKGFGEVNLLTESFHDMGTKLISRDKHIQDLMQDQIEKVRLSAELSVAKEIQDSLLPREPVPPDSGLMIDAIYFPASEVAGDWFSYAYEPKSKTTVIAIVDVSGHGTGASMYTAITAAIFSEYIERYFKGEIRDEYFLRSLNDNIRKFGKEKWSATGQLLIFDGNNKKLTILNAGHTPAMLRLIGSEFRPQSMPSDIMGLTDNFKINRKEIDFSSGCQIVSYTDGLSDRMNPSGKLLGTPGIRKILNSIPDVSPHETVNLLKKRAENHAQGLAAHDDTCIIVVKSA